MFQLWALVKIPTVCNLEQRHILSRLRTMCVVFTTPCRLDGPQSFCALFRTLTEFVFKFVQGWLSIPVYGVSVNLELLARVWLAGAVRAFTTLCFLKYSFNKKKTVWWENSEVDLSVWPTLISAEVHWLGFIICWGVGDGYGAGAYQTQLVLSWPVHEHAWELSNEAIKSANGNKTGNTELQILVLRFGDVHVLFV